MKLNPCKGRQNGPVVDLVRSSSSEAIENEATESIDSSIDNTPFVIHKRSVETLRRGANRRELLFSLSFFLVCSLSCMVCNYLTHPRSMPVQRLPSDAFGRWRVVLSMICPLVAQYFIAARMGHGHSSVTEKEMTTHATLCVYLVAFGITIFCTDRIKAYCGYLRPTFYDQCPGVELDDGSRSYESCLTNNVNLARSFPSGHASMAFCGLTLLTLYFHNTFGVPRLRRERNRQQTALKSRTNSPTCTPGIRQTNGTTGALQSSTCDGSTIYNYFHPLRYRFMSILSLVPIGLALFITAGRVMDNRHFPADAVGGSLLGAAVAIFVNNLWQV